MSGRQWDVPVAVDATGRVFTVRVEAMWPPKSAVNGAETKEVER